MVVILINDFLHIDMFYLYYRQISSTKRLSGHTVIQVRYNANALHTSSRTTRKRVYHNMKNLQSDRSNFGVKILTFEKFHTRGDSTPQNVLMCQFSQQSDRQIFQDRADGRTDVRCTPSMPLG